MCHSFKWAGSPKTAHTMPDLLSRIDGLAKRMPILINHHRSLLVVRHLFNAMERDFCVPCSAGPLAHDCFGVLAQVETPLDGFQCYPALVELSTAHIIIIVHFDDSPRGFGHPDHALLLGRLEHCDDHTVRGFASRFASIFSAQVKRSQIRDGGSRVWYTFASTQLLKQSTARVPPAVPSTHRTPPNALVVCWEARWQ